MLLKPATPLSVLLLAAFILLLLSVLSTPVVKSIPLATFQDVHFGVFGYCQGNVCSGFRVGYPSDGIFGDSKRDGDFNLPATIRHSLSALLIVHPIAALLAFICFALAAAAHLHSPSHSPRYLLGLLILLLPTLLLSLLAFLVDILLFVPYLQWGGWIVLGATILLTSSGVVTCAMRRTLVSRKARKRRIAENAEMSGENFYNRQMAAKVDVAPVGTTYDQKAPLTRAASTTANGSTLANGNTYSPVNRRPQPEPIGYPRPAPTPPVNDYSSSQQNSYGSPYAIRSDPNLRNQFSNTSMRSARSDGPLYPPRGRGGFPPRGRGRPYGGPPGFAPGNGRGGMRPGPSRRGRGGPPVGYPPQNRGYPPLNDYSGYGPGPTLGGRGAPIENSGPRNVNPTMNTNLGRQAMEMHPSSETVPEARTVARDDPGLIENPKSPTSVYSADAPYVPPRSNWRQQEQPVGQLSTDQPRPPMSPLEPSAQPRDMTRTPPLGAPYPPSSYYEDVEPQFALPMTGVESADVPTTLVPGSFGEPPLRTFFDEFPGGPRSPADTESSHFTSISQRGINPQWRPPGSESAKASVQHRQDVLLSNNPDFALPTGRARANTGVGGRMPAPTPMPTIPGTPTGYRTDGIHFF